MSQESCTVATNPPLRRRYRILFATARGLSLLLGTFTLLNVIGELRNPGFDANLWWIDLRFADRILNRVIMVAVGVTLISFAIRPRFSPFRGRLLSGLISSMIMIAAMNSWTFYRLTSTGVIRSSSYIPLSAVVLIVLALILWTIPLRTRVNNAHRLDHISLAVAVVLGAGLFPLAQMYCFGLTDYRRPADVIVVFGCRVFSDGVPSMALSDRVRTGVELYHQGLAPRLLFSGGPGDGDVHETDAMRNLAITLGVPERAIDVDPDGLNTQATVQNLVSRQVPDRATRVLAVSNFYHLPRIKLCFRRAGWEVWTVPAAESRRMYYQERYLLREIAALW